MAQQDKDSPCVPPPLGSSERNRHQSRRVALEKRTLMYMHTHTYALMLAFLWPWKRFFFDQRSLYRGSFLRV